MAAHLRVFRENDEIDEFEEFDEHDAPAVGIRLGDLLPLVGARSETSLHMAKRLPRRRNSHLR